MHAEVKSATFCITFVFLRRPCANFHSGVPFYIHTSSTHSLLSLCVHTNTFFVRRRSSSEYRSAIPNADLLPYGAVTVLGDATSLVLSRKKQDLLKCVISISGERTYSLELFDTLGIDEPLHIKRRKIIKPGFIHSPWKSAYIRQHRIDTNWRRGELKSPKVTETFSQ